MLSRSILRNISRQSAVLSYQKREISKFFIAALVGAAVAGIYANQGTILQYMKNTIMNSNTSNKTVAELIPEKSRQDAAKFLVDSLSPEEKAKLFESMQKDAQDKKVTDDKK